MMYEGFFVYDRLTGRLARDISNKHVTTEFRPAKSHESLYGKRAIFRVIGYANDGKNEGYKVELVSCEARELEDLYKAIPVPHLTLSVSEDGKPVNTARLNFQPIKYSFEIQAVFGGFTPEGVVV